MRLAQLRKYDIANGSGIRVTAFVSGCHFKCNGCFNKEYQSYDYGEVITFSTIDNIIKLIKDKNISGFSILGGEPFDQNLSELEYFLREIKENTSKSIWMWSGYTYEALDDFRKYIVDNYVDVLVDGQYVAELRDISLRFKGSKNQRIIDVKKSLKEGKVILFE